MVRRCHNRQSTSRVESWHLPSYMDDMRTYSKLTGKTRVMGISRYADARNAITISSWCSSRLSLQLPTTTTFNKSIANFTWCAIPQDPFTSSMVSATQGIIAQKNILSEGNVIKHGHDRSGEVEEVLQTANGTHTPPLMSTDSDAAITETEWREEMPNMMPSKQGKRHNQEHGGRMSVMPKRPSPKVPQILSTRKFEADWVLLPEMMTNKGEPINLNALIGEYLQNTPGLMDLIVGLGICPNKHAVWCGVPAEHTAE